MAACTFFIPFSRSPVITITIGCRGRNAPPGSTPNYLLAQSLPLSLLFLLHSRTEAKSVARPGDRNGASQMRGHFRNTMPPDGDTPLFVEVPFLTFSSSAFGVLPGFRVECGCRRRSSRCPVVWLRDFRKCTARLFILATAVFYFPWVTYDYLACFFYLYFL